MLTLREVSKSFPGVHALDHVSLDVRPKEIHAIVGENGAGKSTLVKVIAGALSPDSGEIVFDGAPVTWSSPGEAKRAGIHVVYQEFALFGHLSAAENIFIDDLPLRAFGIVDHRAAQRASRDLLARLGLEIDPRTPVRLLSVADQQMIEVARALVHNAKLLILDEPTAVISGRETQLLFERLRRLRDAGVSIIFISHRLEEVFDLCDRVTVLKDGKLAGTADVAKVTREGLISMMVGRNIGELFPPKRTAAPDAARVVLRAKNLSIAGRVQNVSLELRAGEITALAGMVGSGRSELALGLFGALPLAGGSLEVDDRPIARMTPAKAAGLGIGLVPEDRKGMGLALLLDVAANISAPSLGEVSRRGLVDQAIERQIAEQEISRYRIACRGPATPVISMSGGNQQKVLVARWARRCRLLLILDEPTRGVDVGAKAEIYRLMRDLAEAGIAILMISSEMMEVIGMADRVFVMREGRMTGELVGAEIEEERIMHLATTAAEAA
jgi:ABC-type sugar transport system ATPase subunit